VIGRPILYKTTKEFLLRFGLKDLNELPSIEEFEKMAGELADAELEPQHEGGLTTSEAEQSLNEEDDDAEGQPVDPVNNGAADSAAEGSASQEPVMEEQKAGEA
jgi:segregation and condensation protein B